MYVYIYLYILHTSLCIRIYVYAGLCICTYIYLFFYVFLGCRSSGVVSGFCVGVFTDFDISMLKGEKREASEQLRDRYRSASAPNARGRSFG